MGVCACAYCVQQKSILFGVCCSFSVLSNLFVINYNYSGLHLNYLSLCLFLFVRSILMVCISICICQPTLKSKRPRKIQFCACIEKQIRRVQFLIDSVKWVFNCMRIIYFINRYENASILFIIVFSLSLSFFPLTFLFLFVY